LSLIALNGRTDVKSILFAVKGRPEHSVEGFFTTSNKGSQYLLNGMTRHTSDMLELESGIDFGPKGWLRAKVWELGLGFSCLCAAPSQMFFPNFGADVWPKAEGLYLDNELIKDGEYLVNVTAYNTTSLSRYVARSKVKVGEVSAEVQVRWDLASAYRLHPPLCAVPRFRMRIRRQGVNKRSDYLETSKGGQSLLRKL
jgi:hypothetical protein